MVLVYIKNDILKSRNIFYYIGNYDRKDNNRILIGGIQEFRHVFDRRTRDTLSRGWLQAFTKKSDTRSQPDMEDRKRKSA
jgi:hypothetical protein